MPYTVDSPPEAVKGLPKHAIEIFVAAFNAALAQYKDEGKAMATAWAAVGQKFEKVDDKWVAKESGTLQSLYSEIIQEAGRRNASKDEARIRKILEMCQELLSDLKDAEKEKEAVTEARAVLELLKTRDLVKVEGGVKYPAAAYAYTPDDPSQWELRMWEADTATRPQLKKAAGQLSPGYQGKMNVPGTALQEVKRKIRNEFRNLGVEDAEIPKWVKEAEQRTVFDNYKSLEEAEVGTKGIAKVVIIAPGWGNAADAHYYPAETLSRDYAVFEGAKMYADHQTLSEEKERPEGSIKEWVASLRNVNYQEGVGIVGEAVIIEPWLQAKLAVLRDKNLLSEMGISIRAVGVGTKAKIDGKDANVVERITRVRSVDFVTEAGAGGLVTLYEAGTREYDIDIVSLSTLRERRPDLIKMVETEVRETIKQEVKIKMELQEQVNALTLEKETLTTENTTLKSTIAEAEKNKVIAETKASIDLAVGKAELPDPAKARLLEKFKGAESDKGLEEAIQAEKDYIAKLTESGKVKNMGGTNPDPKVNREVIVESVKSRHPEWKDAQIDAYIDGR